MSTRFLSAGTQVVETRQLLPLPLPEADEEAAERGSTAAEAASRATPSSSPTPRSCSWSWRPRALEAEIFAALLEGAGVVHTAQQRAMAAATENADELVRTLTRVMNRARQDAITTEIMEIVGGAEALRQVEGSMTAMTTTACNDTAPAGSLEDGRVVAIAGPVVDVEFPPHALPEINHAVELDIELDGETARVTAEVAQQIGEGRVRCICMQPTDGLVRGAAVRNTGRGITVPVGNAVLGHVFNVLGQPLDTDDIGPRRRPLGDPPRRAGLRPARAARPDVRDRASRSSTCSSPTCRAARSASSAAPASARPSSSMEMINRVATAARRRLGVRRRRRAHP